MAVLRQDLLPCQGDIFGLAEPRIRTKPCGIRASGRAALCEKLRLTNHDDIAPLSPGRFALFVPLVTGDASAGVGAASHDDLCHADMVQQASIPL
ncbi:MAG: hypothetical protein DWQ45_01960 [Planctomycetota bacterium]|nr:MAG: hypothetical protein DWQ29_05950 [Planctomycetota bacterium]REK28908.1 MAG: hypothetical protein DWQ41_04985 [Planctomycetota bacterium]REK39658.1 MAG: hypothetical protein DWQ45_01960 [Planctomycetota bacterium]